LGEWEATYDHVFFDVPSVLAVTDSVIVGSLCQGILLVMRANVTSRRMVKRTQALLEAAHVSVVGLVWC
jgi:protein-tyrosine kinase